MLNRALSLLLALTLLCAGASAAEYDQWRVLVGAKLFRSLVAADQQLADKLDAQGRVDLVVLYHEDPDAPTEALDWLHGKTRSGIQSHPAIIRKLPLGALTTQSNVPSALFIAERLPDTLLQAVIQYANSRGIVLYSPFEGDVEAGVFAGVSVEAQVRPYINREAMRAAGLSIKPFFLKIARTYE